MIEGILKEGFITTSYDSVVNWPRPVQFGP